MAPKGTTWVALGLAYLAGAATTQAAVDIVPFASWITVNWGGCQDPAISRVSVTALGRNDGDTDLRGEVGVVWFQDMDANGRFSAADITVGRATLDGSLVPPGRVFDIAGSLPPFLPEPLRLVWVEFDPDFLIAESDETNNTAPVGYPCSVDGNPFVPLANLTLSLTSVTVVLAGRPGCAAHAVIDARVTNTGNLDPGSVVRAWTYPRAPVAAPDVVVPPPGGFTDFTIEVPLDAPMVITVVIDDDGTSTGSLDECNEGDNRCAISADPASAPSSTAQPIGPALRATGHSDPLAAIITGDFNWLLDAGAPRPVNDSFVVFQSMVPWQLDEVVMFPPLRQPRWTSATPRGTRDPTVHFILVAAADECGRIAE